MFFLLWPELKLFVGEYLRYIESEREKYFRKRERCIVLLLQLLLAVGSFAASAVVRFLRLCHDDLKFKQLFDKNNNERRQGKRIDERKRQ